MRQPSLWLSLLIVAGGSVIFQFHTLKAIRSSSIRDAQWDHPLVIRSATNDSMKACLLTCDDNHFLTEWLAFHYQTLPLRRLIVAVDPRARTSPHSIINRWKDLINITFWNDADYFPKSYRISILRSKRHNNTEDKLLQLHRYRQRFFYLQCMRQLKNEADIALHSTTTSSSSDKRRQEWVALIDVDEFLFPNWNWEYASFLPDPQTDATIRQVLNRLGSYERFRHPCIGLPRLLIGAKEDNHITNDSDMARLSLLHSLNISSASDMLTFGWKWHGKLDEFGLNKAGKALVDISRIDTSQLSLSQMDVHRPVMDVCEAENMWTRNTKSPLILNHYVGTYEQFTFRSDPRKGRQSREKYETLREINDGRLDRYDTERWLLELISELGKDSVKALLDGVGQIETNVTPPLDLDESQNALYQLVLAEFGAQNATESLARSRIPETESL